MSSHNRPKKKFNKALDRPRNKAGRSALSRYTKNENDIKFNFDGKIFVSIANTENGEVGDGTLFHYHQDGNIVTAEYEGGSIVKGHLIAKVLGDGKLE